MNHCREEASEACPCPSWSLWRDRRKCWRLIIVDDDPDYAILVKRVLNRAGIEGPRICLLLGRAGRHRCSRTGGLQSRRHSSGSEMPRVRGVEVLESLRSRPGLRSTPVFMMSFAHRQRLRLRRVVKPLGLGELHATILNILPHVARGRPEPPLIGGKPAGPRRPDSPE
jgi:CheY-like chemotaxis protein